MKIHIFTVGYSTALDVSILTVWLYVKLKREALKACLHQTDKILKILSIGEVPKLAIWRKVMNDRANTLLRFFRMNNVYFLTRINVLKVTAIISQVETKLKNSFDG